MKGLVGFFDGSPDFNMKTFSYPEIAFLQKFILFLHHDFHILQLQSFFKSSDGLFQRINQRFLPVEVELDVEFFIPQAAAKFI